MAAAYDNVLISKAKSENINGLGKITTKTCGSYRRKIATGALSEHPSQPLLHLCRAIQCAGEYLEEKWRYLFRCCGLYKTLAQVLFDNSATM